MRDFLTESVVMAGSRGIAGVGLGFLVVSFLGWIRIPTDTPLVLVRAIVARVLFSLAVAMVSALRSAWCR